MNKIAVVLGIALICSFGVNLLQLKQAATQQQTLRTNHFELKKAGRDTGWRQAESDYAAGNPCWYAMGDFAKGGMTLPDKQGRKLVCLGLVSEDYGNAFVETYNKRMDELLARKPKP